VIKQVSLVRRGAGIEPGSFAAAWAAEAERGVERLAARARPSRLIHYVVRDRRGDAPHHGVSAAWFADAAALAEVDGVLVEDGAEPVAIRSAPAVIVEERCVVGGEWLEAHGRRGDDPALALVGLIQRAPHLTRAAFADYWWDRHRPFIDTVVPRELEPVAYVHNYVLEGQPGEWDGIGEIYEASLDVPRRRGEWLETPEVIADEERFLLRSTRVVLVTDRWVIVPG
jgi:hypothetical protein